MGARPYAGIAPRGMTSKQYSELEYNVGNANEMPDSVFNKRVDKETQKSPINMAIQSTHRKNI